MGLRDPGGSGGGARLRPVRGAGVAFGALVTNQVVAVVLALLWVLLIESLVVSLKARGRQVAAGWCQSVDPGRRQPDRRGALPPGLAVVVLLGYTVVFAALAARTTLRRDIT